MCLVSGIDTEVDSACSWSAWGWYLMACNFLPLSTNWEPTEQGGFGSKSVGICF
jgi:hypothetical protein